MIVNRDDFTVLFTFQMYKFNAEYFDSNNCIIMDCTGKSSWYRVLADSS